MKNDEISDAFDRNALRELGGAGRFDIRCTQLAVRNPAQWNTFLFDAR